MILVLQIAAGYVLGRLAWFVLAKLAGQIDAAFRGAQ